MPRPQWMDEAAKELKAEEYRRGDELTQGAAADVIERFWEAEQLRNPDLLRQAVESALQSLWEHQEAWGTVASRDWPEFQQHMTSLSSLTGHKSGWKASQASNPDTLRQAEMHKEYLAGPALTELQMAVRKALTDLASWQNADMGLSDPLYGRFLASMGRLAALVEPAALLPQPSSSGPKAP